MNLEKKIKELEQENERLKHDNESYEFLMLRLNEENKKLKADRKQLLELTMSYIETYDVLKEMFENNNPTLWGMITGAFYGTFNSKKIVEQITKKRGGEICK